MGTQCDRGTLVAHDWMDVSRMTEPRRPGRPRRITPETTPENTPQVADQPPGPIQLEIRVNGKIACLQRVHSYKIDQQEDTLTVTGVLRVSGGQA